MTLKIFYLVLSRCRIKFILKNIVNLAHKIIYKFDINLKFLKIIVILYMSKYNQHKIYEKYDFFYEMINFEIRKK